MVSKYTDQEARRQAQRPQTHCDQTFREGIFNGQFTIHRDETAWTDTGHPDGRVHLYTSGSDLVLQIFDKSQERWLSVTLT